MPVKELFCARKGAEDMYMLKQHMGADEAKLEAIIRSHFGDSWHWGTVEVERYDTGAQMDVNRAAQVFPKDRPPYTDIVALPMQRFLVCVKFFDGKPPTETLYRSLGADVTTGIDEWLVNLMWGGLTQDEDFSNALSQLRTDSGLNNPSR